MFQRKSSGPKLAFVAALLLLAVVAGVVPTHGEAASNGIQTPKWTVPNLPSLTNCPPNNHPNCHGSSPVVADLTGDNIPDIVVGTSNGHVVAVRHNGSVLWNVDLGPLFGMSSNQEQIFASPAVADIDNDGQPEVVVATGAKSQAYCTQGGVIVLKGNNGQKENGWPFYTVDEHIPPAGCRDSIFSTPALGDIDNDGDMEIVVGSFDKRIYMLHHNGVLDPHFPVDSVHQQRFPYWDFGGKLADTIWSSPALADMNGDGYLDILIGTDEGDFDDNFPGGDGWTCPYRIPIPGWPDAYCGGSLYVVDRFGQHLPGFPRRIHEGMQSSPALYDIDADGTPEIFVGAGTFYNTISPDNPSLSYRIYGWDHEGKDLPGWQGGKVTGGSTPASPAIGNIAGDAAPEIVALSMDRKLYAWHTNGAAVSGFPMTPINAFVSSNPYDVGLGPLLADYDGDGRMEIFMRIGWEVVVVDGNGQILTNTNNSSPNGPQYYANGLLDNNPAVGDIDNDGQLELIAHNSTLYAWDLPDAGDGADWPMFRRDAARTGAWLRPTLDASPEGLVIMQQVGASVARSRLRVANAGPDSFTWTATATHGSVSLQPGSGSASEDAPSSTRVTVNTAGLPVGTHSRGQIQIAGTTAGAAVAGSPAGIPVQVIMVRNLHQIFLPVVR